MNTICTVYTPEVINIIMSNSDMKRKDLAKQIGVTDGSLTGKICELNKKGDIVIKKKKCKKEIGAITIRKDRNYHCRWTKTEKGWRRLPLNAKETNDRKFYTDADGVKKVKTIIPRKKLTKVPKQIKQFKSRTIDLSTKTRVFIPELRMHVFVNPDKAINKVREKYLSKRMKF